MNKSGEAITVVCLRQLFATPARQAQPILILIGALNHDVAMAQSDKSGQCQSIDARRVCRPEGPFYGVRMNDSREDFQPVD